MLGAGKATRAEARRHGVLVASGFLVGESVFGVLLAGLDVMSGRSGTLALDPGAAAPWLGPAAFLAILAGLYAVASRRVPGLPSRFAGTTETVRRLIEAGNRIGILVGSWPDPHLLLFRDGYRPGVDTPLPALDVPHAC